VNELIPEYFQSAPDALQHEPVFAAIDIGSNSFHLIVARLEHGEIRPLHVLAEKVQLGKGLKNHQLAADAVERGLACLERFQQLLASVKPDRIRAVGTNALRQAHNRELFTEPAEAILGVPVDVIYGREEARLVYLGVAHTLADDELSRLVVDIGGGSTEFILGQQFEPKRLESLQLGCVSYSERFFPDGKIDKKRFRAAYDQACIEVSHIRRHFKQAHWVEAVGSSGTLQAIELLVSAAGWRSEGIDHKSLKKLKKALLKFESVDDIDLEGLNERRRGVITAGVAITLAIFDVLGVGAMRTSSGALREGAIYDLIGRRSHEDVRERTVQAMLQRYSAEIANSDSVGAYAKQLGIETASAWNLSEDDIDLLAWSGRLHEIGIAISQKHYNRHSAYLVENSDMPGFSQGDQLFISRLLRGHRGKLPNYLFDGVPTSKQQKLARMLVLLRLAVTLKHAEVPPISPEFYARASDARLEVNFSDEWREGHPLTVWEVTESIPVFKKLGITLEIPSA
jgi:exopolyphosphatase/guanosine-5'-triphosphate,3'-diphosphate pyrophosphatase